MQIWGVSVKIEIVKRLKAIPALRNQVGLPSIHLKPRPPSWIFIGQPVSFGRTSDIPTATAAYLRSNTLATHLLTFRHAAISDIQLPAFTRHDRPTLLPIRMSERTIHDPGIPAWPLLTCPFDTSRRIVSLHAKCFIAHGRCTNYRHNKRLQVIAGGS